jgi:nitrile hydratase
VTHTGDSSVDGPEIRSRALESLLYEKGLLDPDAVDAVIGSFERGYGPLNGARVIAHAWTDPAYRRRLLDDAPAAVAELGFREGEQLVALANTADVHNVVVCTLCSCYPWTMLGLPPRWYKDPSYRSRVVIEPRSVLAELGLELGEDVEVRVWDSNSELRYLVVPERPQGTDEMTEEELVGLVSRDSMIGVARASSPVDA